MLPIATARATYPDRPVRIVVPFLPGGGADLIARLLSPQLQHSLGQPFVVENRAGAAGRIGTGVVAKSDPDGHVLLMTTESSLVIAPHIGVPLNYEPLKDFAPISLLTRNSVILVVHPSVPANTLKDYIALVRDKPGQLFFASSGVGGPNHLAGEIFNRMAGGDIVHVPFPGTGGAIQAVVGNQVGAMWGFMAGLIPHIRSGAVRALAVGGKARSPALPDVPTVAESALPSYEATSWIGLLAPATTPVVEVVWEAVKYALQDAAVRDILLRDGSEIVASRPEDFREVIPNDYAKYGQMGDLLMSAKGCAIAAYRLELARVTVLVSGDDRHGSPSADQGACFVRGRSRPRSAAARSTAEARLALARLPSRLLDRGAAALERLGARVHQPGRQGGRLARPVLREHAQYATRNLHERHVRLELRCRRHSRRGDAASGRGGVVGRAGDGGARRSIRPAGAGCGRGGLRDHHPDRPRA